MQHNATVSGTTEQPQSDWLPTVVYLLVVALLFLLIGLLLWPSLTAAPPRDAAYVNPEVRLAERYRSGEWTVPAIQAVSGPLYTKELARYQQQLALESRPQHLVDPYWTHFHDYMTAPSEATIANLVVNPELKYADALRVQARPMADFEHTNPEVGLIRRLAAFERSR